MKRIWTCRRTYVATLAILALLGLGIYLKDASVASPISVVAIGLAASNSYQGKKNV